MFFTNWKKIENFTHAVPFRVPIWYTRNTQKLRLWFLALPLCLFVPDKAVFILAVRKLHCVKPLRVQNLHCVGLYSLGTLCKNRIAVSRYIVILYFRYTVQKLHLYTICCHTVPKIKVGSTNQSRSDNHSGFECSDRT